MTEFMRHSDGYGMCKVLCCRGRFYYVQWHDGSRGWCKRRYLTPFVAVHVTENNVLAIYNPEFHGKHYVYISESEWLDYKEFGESKFEWGHRISALKEKQSAWTEWGPWWAMKATTSTRRSRPARNSPRCPARSNLSPSRRG